MARGRVQFYVWVPVRQWVSGAPQLFTRVHPLPMICPLHVIHVYTECDKFVYCTVDRRVSVSHHHLPYFTVVIFGVALGF